MATFLERLWCRSIPSYYTVFDTELQTVKKAGNYSVLKWISPRLV